MNNYVDKMYPVLNKTCVMYDLNIYCDPSYVPQGAAYTSAMANASMDLDNVEAQGQLNNNRPASSRGHTWDSESTSAKLFECSRIKALAGIMHGAFPSFSLLKD